MEYFSFRKYFLLYLVFFLYAIVLVSAFSEVQSERKLFLNRRRTLAAAAETEAETETVQPKKKTNLETEAETETVQAKKKTNLSTKNQTKLIKPTTNSTKTATLSKTIFKKLNSTSKFSNSTKTKSTSSTSTSKISNSPKTNSTSTKKSLDLSKPITPKNKTQPIIITKQSQALTEKKPKQQKIQKPTKPDWMDRDETEFDEDLVSEFRDLPTKFHQSLFPDIERISTTSKAYITKANKEITAGFKPLVGNKYAPTIASVISFIFILLPLLLVSLIFNRIKAYFSLQKLLIFIQVYLSIYFSILSVSSLVTGLEPLKFFYATSQSSYVCLQVLQTLGYMMYLLLLLMYLILVFSTETSLGLKALGLAQTIVGFSVGLHYYVSVFHRAILHQPPKTNWKIHGIYATCFLLICLFAGAERSKKAYLAEGGEEGKKS